jgi:hypothetical protein
VSSPPFIEHAIWQWHDSAYTAAMSPAQALQVLHFAGPFLAVEHALMLWRHAVEVRIVSQQFAQALATLLTKQLCKLVDNRTEALASMPKDAPQFSPLDDVVDECAAALVAVLSDWSVLERDAEELGLLCTNSSNAHVQRWTDPAGNTHWLDARSMRVMQCVQQCDAHSAPPPPLESFTPAGSAWLGWHLMRKNHYKPLDPRESLLWLLRSKLFANDETAWGDVDAAGLGVSATSMHSQSTLDQPHSASNTRSEHKLRVARHIEERFMLKIRDKAAAPAPLLSDTARAAQAQHEEFHRFLAIKDAIR